MLLLAFWFLTQTPGSAVSPAPGVDQERWELRIDLPRNVDVAGVGLFEARSSTVFLLRGPLSKARVQRCSLEIDSPFASATATHFVDPRVPIVFEGKAGGDIDGAAHVLRADDAAALMPAGPIRFELRAGGVAIGAMTAEVEGRFSLLGRRDGARVTGTVALTGARDRVYGPAFITIAVASSEAVRGTFSLRPTSARRCIDLSPAATTNGGSR